MNNDASGSARTILVSGGISSPRRRNFSRSAVPSGPSGTFATKLIRSVIALGGKIASEGMALSINGQAGSDLAD